MSKFLEGTRPCATPEAATAMYARHGTIPWSIENKRIAVREMRALRKTWVHTGRPGRDWDNAKDFPNSVRPKGKAGSCKDFCPELKRRLILAGLPPEALRLVLCSRAGEEHMVLAIETGQGTMICDDPHGIARVDKPRWRLHVFKAWETAGRGWESVETVSVGSLEDLAK